MKKGTAIFPGWLFPFVYCVAGVDAYSVGEGGGAYCFLIKWMNPRLLDARKAAEKSKFCMDVSSACRKILKKYPCFPIGVGL